MITGEKVMLRAIEPSDIKQFWEWSQDEEIMRLRNYPQPPRSLEEYEKEFNQAVDGPGSELRLAIVTREGQLLGEITLNSIDSRIGDAELSIWIGVKTHWGKGFGSDAVRTLSKYAFEQLNLHRVTLYVHETNLRAIRAYQKCGFKEEGRLREAEYMDGKYTDIMVMGLLRRDFEELINARDESRRTLIVGRT